MKKYLEYIIVIGILLITLVGVLIYKKSTLKPYDRNYFYMDTYINVKLYSNSENKALKALDEIDKIFMEYHNLTDMYNSYEGGLYNLNNGSTSVNPKLKDIISYGYSWYDKSDGLLNIAIANVSSLWKEYIKKEDGVPKLSTLEKLNINIKDVIINDNITLNNNVKIDLGAIAKGYTCDEVAKYLKSIGITKYIINAGGNVLVGEKVKKDGYKIGIQSPYEDDKLVKILKISDKAIVTSGGYNRGYTYNGVKYNHIINPKTLYPADNMLSVTVISSSSALADALSTTLFLMDVETGMEFIKGYDAEAIWYLEDNVYMTDGFKNYE